MTRPFRQHGVRLMGVMRVLVFLALVVAGCGGDPVPQQAAMDGLTVPSSWQAAKTISSAGCLKIANPDCPSVIRYFLVPEDLPVAFVPDQKGTCLRVPTAESARAFGGSGISYGPPSRLIRRTPRNGGHTTSR